MKRLKSLFLLLFSMLKVGLFTFGGGYAMISLLDNEFVTRRGWLDADEFGDIVTVAESTPGPIAINCATYIGYKREGFFGALFATVGMCIPSFVIILLISLVFDRFLEISWVAAAFCGIRACVIFLVLSAGLKMLKKMKKTAFSVTVTAVTLVSMLLLTLFSVSFSSIFYILIFGALSLLIYSVKGLRDKSQSGEVDK